MTKQIEIRVEPTRRDPYKFVIKVFADGVLADQRPAHVGTVVKARNQMAQHWSNHPDGPSVYASAIPWPPEYNNGGER